MASDNDSGSRERSHNRAFWLMGAFVLAVVVLQYVRSRVTPAIVRAVMVNDIAAVTERLHKNPDALNTLAFFDDESLLHVAARNASTDMVKLLLEKGLPVDARDNSGRTPLHVAVGRRSGAVGMVRYLLDAGADVEAARTNGWRPLHVAAIQSAYVDNLKVIVFLVEHGADVMAQDRGKATPLHYVVDTYRNAHQDNRIAVAEYLLRQGADLRAKTVSGHTPLALANNPEKKYSAKMLDFLTDWAAAEEQGRAAAQD